MAGQGSDGKSRWLWALPLAILLALAFLIPFCWKSAKECQLLLWTGYYPGVVLLAAGLFGLSIPKTHLFHQEIFRLAAIFGLIILLLSVCYPISTGIIDHLKAAPAVETPAEKPPAKISGSLSNDPQSISIETTKGTRNK